MDDDYQSFDSPSGDGGSGRRSRLPAKLNIQTVATAILVVALVAVVFMFFFPSQEPDTTLSLPTATTLATTLPGTPGTLPAPGATMPGATSAPVGTAGVTTFGTPVAGAVTTGTASVGALAGLTPGTPGTAAPAGALAAGSFVRVAGTEGMGIRYRLGPGTDYLTLRIVMDGESLKVMGGPEAASGESWWRLQDQYGNVAWAAQTYLQPAAAPASWAPPAASPTFGAGSGDQMAPVATP